MSGISISELIEQRRRESEREEPRRRRRIREELSSAELTSHSVTTTFHAMGADSGESVNEQGTGDSDTGEDIATLREALYQKLNSTKQEMSKQATIERQKAWMEEVGTSINYYEQREFSTDELEEYYNIVLTKPELLKVDDAPHNLRLTLQFTKWVKEVHAKKILNNLTGVHGYEDEVNKVLGDVDNDIKENDKVKMPFNDRMDFE